MAKIHAQQAPDRIRELEQWGAVFDRTPKGLTSQRNFGGHTYPRLAHIGDATGLELIRTLQQRGIHMGMDVFMEFTVRKLFKKDGKVIGCFSYSRNDGSFHVFKAKSIILATVPLDAGRFALAHGNILVKALHWRTGPVLKWETWSSFNSIPQE